MRATCLVAAGWPMPSSSAARLKEPRSTTRVNRRSALIRSMSRLESESPSIRYSTMEYASFAIPVFRRRADLGPSVPPSRHRRSAHGQDEGRQWPPCWFLKRKTSRRRSACRAPPSTHAYAAARAAEHRPRAGAPRRGRSHMAEGYTRAQAGNIGVHRHLGAGRHRHDHGAVLGQRRQHPHPVHHRPGAARPPVQGGLPGGGHRVHRQAGDQVGGHRARAGAGARAYCSRPFT